ncbi:DUF4231 domain-containing protein [Rhodococcus sp. ARC_M6]|uniref:DUF4231 domain-containing protein n=1 Tax=Rhodococcus sp. ARC_M6 TaxID=2928852 RepID=UPI001FB20255|nr:DUF4231 domain-containing protein [Rhodococcus sp. ARC_M6]MCJ0905985.1 DUF4231 domain-containing protein [Rhodococcus sp. ARC_M6]
MADTDMPQLFQAADQASLEAQKAYVGGTRNRLLLLGAAALLGIFTWRVGVARIDVFALVGMGIFVAALLIDSNLWRERPDKAWYDGRAVAESTKTLAWKFAVCGLPFPADLSGEDAAQALLERMHSVREQFRDLQLTPLDVPLISEWMVLQRDSTLEDRRQSYLTARISDQKGWYARKASYNRSRAKRWRSTLVTLELAGVASSLWAAFSESVTALAPAIAALVVGVVAWTETKQHDANARAYAAAVADLASAEAKLQLAVTEESWAREVDDAEEAISREHVIWLATRSRL